MIKFFLKAQRAERNSTGQRPVNYRIASFQALKGRNQVLTPLQGLQIAIVYYIGRCPMLFLSLFQSLKKLDDRVILNKRKN